MIQCGWHHPHYIQQIVARAHGAVWQRFALCGQRIGHLLKVVLDLLGYAESSGMPNTSKLGEYQRTRWFYGKP